MVLESTPAFTANACNVVTTVKLYELCLKHGFQGSSNVLTSWDCAGAVHFAFFSDQSMKC